MIDTIPRWWPELEAMPRTLIHNDFNPRNICLRMDPCGDDGLRLVAYDWELATIRVPQRDLAELLCFTLQTPIDPATVDRLVELHRRSLESESGRALHPAAWRRGYALSLRDFMVTRATLYLMAHTFRDYRFLCRVLETTRALLENERDRLGRDVRSVAT
jgi:aminoglycoside phosphotransferase (APT) family kinase protein